MQYWATGSRLRWDGLSARLGPDMPTQGVVAPLRLGTGLGIDTASLPPDRGREQDYA